MIGSIIPYLAGIRSRFIEVNDHNTAPKKKNIIDLLVKKMALVVSPEYGYCIAIAVATGFHYTMQTVGVAKVRYSAMSREYFEKHFAAENEGTRHEQCLPDLCLQ